MTVFRQENLEEHYETGEDLGRWVRAGGGSGRWEPLPLSAAGRGARAGGALATWSAPALPFHPSEVLEDGKGSWVLSCRVFFFRTAPMGFWTWAGPK